MENYLAKKDILSCGWLLKTQINNKTYFRDEDDKFGITIRPEFYKDGGTNLHIYEFNLEGLGTIFSGEIKNKTEFKKLLKQLKIQ